MIQIRYVNLIIKEIVRLDIKLYLKIKSWKTGHNFRNVVGKSWRANTNGRNDSIDSETYIKWFAILVLLCKPNGSGRLFALCSSAHFCTNNHRKSRERERERDK